MTARNFVMTAADEAMITPETLRRHASYEGDHEFALLMRAMARKLLAYHNPLMTPNTVETFLNSDVDALHLSVRAATTLKMCDFRNVRQVFEGGWAYLMRQRNFGERSRLELVDLFARYGLIWQEGICDAPKLEISETQITCPASLYSDLLRAAQSDFDHFVLEHGRFATRGKNLPEYTRLRHVLERAQALVKQETDNDN